MPFPPSNTPMNAHALLFKNTHTTHFRSLSTVSTEAGPPCKGICTTLGETEDAVLGPPRAGTAVVPSLDTLTCGTHPRLTLSHHTRPTRQFFPGCKPRKNNNKNISRQPLMCYRGRARRNAVRHPPPLQRDTQTPLRGNHQQTARGGKQKTFLPG